MKGEEELDRIWAKGAGGRNQSNVKEVGRVGKEKTNDECLGLGKAG